jgi:hypothetical protein
MHRRLLLDLRRADALIPDRPIESVAHESDMPIAERLPLVVNASHIL